MCSTLESKDPLAKATASARPSCRHAFSIKPTCRSRNRTHSSLAPQEFFDDIRRQQVRHTDQIHL